MREAWTGILIALIVFGYICYDLGYKQGYNVAFERELKERAYIQEVHNQFLKEFEARLKKLEK